MKERLTVTLEKDILSSIDKTIDGSHIKNRSHAIELLLLKAFAGNVPKKALILAGGKGTRLEPITHEIPKPLIPIKGKPILQHIIELLKKHNIREVILSVGYKKEKIKEYFGDGSKFGINIVYTEEDKSLGTAGAVKLARQYLNDTFIIINGDNLYDIDITDIYLFHKQNNAVATMALTSTKEPSAYGVVELKGNKIVDFSEKPKKTSSNFINSGFYIAEPAILDLIPEGFAMLEKDVFPKLARQGKLFGYPFSGQWFDITTLKDYDKAIKGWRD